MTSPEERLTEKFISQRKEAYLQAMGITVWHKRGYVTQAQSSQPLAQANNPKSMTAQLRRELAGESSSQVLSDKKSLETVGVSGSQEIAAPGVDKPENVAPISFAWLQLGSVMLLCDERHDKLLQRFGQDVLVTLAWKHRDKHATQSAQSRSQRGGFQWPQLENASGTPARSLSVWFDKYAASGVRYWYAEIDVVKQCQVYTPQVLIGLPNFSEALNSPQVKQSLWLKINESPEQGSER